MSYVTDVIVTYNAFHILIAW